MAIDNTKATDDINFNEVDLPDPSSIHVYMARKNGNLKREAVIVSKAQRKG